jgi:hypothetical protein
MWRSSSGQGWFGKFLAFAGDAKLPDAAFNGGLAEMLCESA